MGEFPPVADWRCAAHYAGLHNAARPCFAWEWLRRRPAYRIACQTAKDENGGECAAEPFGLHRLEPCEYAVPVARPIWRAEVDPYVLSAAISPRSGKKSELFDVRRLNALATCHRSGEKQEHWLFSDGLRYIRLDCLSGSFAAGPIELDYHISGLAGAMPKVVTLSRLIALARTERIPAALFKNERRAYRWTLILRAADALAVGAHQRDIAEHLLKVGTGRRWRIANPSSRRRAQRLVEAAKRAMEADPRLWLTGGFP